MLRRLARDIREGRRSAIAVVSEAFARIEAARHLNAVVSLRVNDALAEAHEIDLAIRHGEPVGPLAGIPVLVKDIEDVDGLPTTFGSRLYQSAGSSRANGLIPGRLRSLGAVIVGKANTPELAIEGYTANVLHGATLNPWATEWSPGGSSGGSAAALAAGLVPIATATDVGGSVRVPAALCGLAGLKPTTGLIGRDPILAAPELNSHGVLGARIPDVRFQLALLSGFTVGDPGSSPLARRRRSHTQWRLSASYLMSPGPKPSADVTSLFDEVVATVEASMAASVAWVAAEDIFPNGYRREDLSAIVGSEMVAALDPAILADGMTLFEKDTRDYLEAARQTSLGEYFAARRRRLSCVRDMDLFLGDDGLLLTPTLTVPGWSPYGRLPGRSDGVLPRSVYNTGPPNLTGHPALSLPGGLHSNGVPFGFQVVGPRYRDSFVLDFGDAWARTRPWPEVAPGFVPFGDAQ